MTDSQAKSQQPGSTGRPVDDEIDLLDYLRVIWRHRWMICLLCVLAMGLTVIISRNKPRQYESAVTIVPPLDILQRESAGGLGSLSSPLLRRMMDTATTGITKMYVEILESREIADAIIDRFHLMDVYENMRYRSNARNRLKRNTTVRTTDGGAVKVTVLDRDPNRSAAIANAYVEELDKQNKRLSAGQATSKRVFLENRLKEVESKLSKIDSILSREMQIQETVYETLVQQYEMAKIEEARNMPTIQVLDPAVVPELPAGRGTVKKGVLAGVAAFMLGIFLAFAVEYVAKARRREPTGTSANAGETATTDPRVPPVRRRVSQGAAPAPEVGAHNG